MAVNGLALGGGGARGGYEMGVWKGIRQLGWEPDIVTGTSVGSLNGALMVQNDYELAEAIWLNIETSQIIDIENKNSLKLATEKLKEAEKYLKLASLADAGLSTEPLGELLRNNVDEGKIRKAKQPFGLVTVRLEPPKLLPQQLFIEDMPEGSLADYLWASSSLFPALKSHIIDGQRYIDGGYFDGIPINMNLTRGADFVLAVDLDVWGITKIPILKGNQKVKTIKPFQDLGPMLKFNGKTSKRNINLGFLDTLKAFKQAKGCYFTFSNDAFAVLLEKEKHNIDKIREVIRKEEKNTIVHLATDSAAKSLEKKYRHELTIKDDLLQICAEAAGEIFGISPEIQYSEEEFIEAVKKAVASYNLEKKVYDCFGFNKIQSMMKKLKFADSPSRSILLKKYLDTLLGNQTSIAQETMALFFPLEFMAGAFLKIIGIEE